MPEYARSASSSLFRLIAPRVGSAKPPEPTVSLLDLVGFPTMLRPEPRPLNVISISDLPVGSLVAPGANGPLLRFRLLNPPPGELSVKTIVSVFLTVAAPQVSAPALKELATIALPFRPRLMP